jgi:hypothetical protein
METAGSARQQPASGLCLVFPVTHVTRPILFSEAHLSLRAYLAVRAHGMMSSRSNGISLPVRSSTPNRCGS